MPVFCCITQAIPRFRHICCVPHAQSGLDTLRPSSVSTMLAQLAEGLAVGRTEQSSAASTTATMDAASCDELPLAAAMSCVAFRHCGSERGVEEPGWNER